MLGEATKAALSSAVAYQVMVAMVAFFLLMPLRAYAEDPPIQVYAEDPPLSVYAEDPAPYGWREVWAGADVSSNVWLLYSGLTVAPYCHMFDDGLRLRIASGYGGYSYEGFRREGLTAKLTSFNARTAFTDVLIGYLKRFGPLTAKGFLGTSLIGHQVVPLDTTNLVQGIDYGPKVVVELWLNMGSDAWQSFDLNWTSAHHTYAGRVRNGYRVLDELSVGVEARIDGNALDKDARGGAFVRYEWQGGEVTIAGGVAGQFFRDAKSMTSPYATATWLIQY